MRRLGLFTLIFIVLAGLYWLLESPVLERSQQENGRLLSGFDPAALARITISCPVRGTVVLQRSGAGWQVSVPGKETSYAADSAAVPALIEALSALHTGTLVSRNPARHALYDVTPAAGVHVEALTRDDRRAADLLIGKNGPNIFSTYVRAADSDDVYLVDGILQGAASKSLNEWRDKTIFELDPAHVNAYTVSGECSLCLRQHKDGWRTCAGEDVNAEAAERLVRTFAGLSAADFAEGPLDSFGLLKPSRTVTAEHEDGTRATLLLGKDANAFQQYAKTATSDTVCVIEKYLLDSLCPTLEQLHMPAAEYAPDKTPAEPSKAQSGRQGDPLQPQPDIP